MDCFTGLHWKSEPGQQMQILLRQNNGVFYGSTWESELGQQMQG